MSARTAGAAAPCAACLRRSWLIARLAGHIEVAWSARRGRAGLLALEDHELIASLAGDARAAIVAEYERFDAAAARGTCARAGVHALCRCDARYPAPLHDLRDAPAVLYVRGRLARLEHALASDRVAIVGARRASPYGLEQARGLGRGIAAAGLTVVSGMALGIDAAAHVGALDADGLTLAVLACGPEQAYPASKRRLHAHIAATGAVVAELPPGTPPRRWCFPARNRIIAALAQATVVVEAGERSGSLITAGQAADLGREVAAVPGLVTSPMAAGTNALIADGAQLVCGAQDVLELLFGAAALSLLPAAADARTDGLEADLRALLERVGAGCDTVVALAADGAGLDAVLAGLAQLELRGLVRRGPGGRYAVTA
ncbi:MAG: DNA-protecting protein DprA [Actinobacteria bacterium]|nr:DNA-protecting protein DprA [Actinomycetota bacterium]